MITVTMLPQRPSALSAIAKQASRTTTQDVSLLASLRHNLAHGHESDANVVLALPE